MYNIQPPTQTQALVAAAIADINEEKRRLQAAAVPNTDSFEIVNPGAGEGKPGEDFNRQTTADGELRYLEGHGWQRDGGDSERYRLTRPGKKDGCSATLTKSSPPILYVFSSEATPFDPNKGYTPFAIRALLEHRGDYSAAAKSLAQQGYGEQRKNGGGYQAKEPAARRQDPSPGAEAQEASAATGIRVVDAADYVSTQPPEPDKIVEDVLDAGDKMAILASSKLRKSFFTLMLALALAVGCGFLKWRSPRPRRVLYVQFEIREHHCHRRTRSLARAMGITPEALSGRLKIISGRGLGLAGSDGLDRILRAVGDFVPEVIVLDPLYKLAQGVENAAEDFKQILAAFDRIAEQTGAAVIFVHHDAKGTPGDKDIRDRGAGSGVLGRDYDACITLTAHANEPDATVVETLLRNYPPQDPFTIVWECTEGGGYCFGLADDVHPEKRTSKCKPAPPPLASYLPIANEILIAGRELEVPHFKSLFKERTRLSDHRVRDFMNWATGGERPPLETREARGMGLHKKWVKLSEA